MKKLLLLIGFALASITACGSGENKPVERKTNLPISSEATFVESYSSSEVSIAATGYGVNMEMATKDLKKAAVLFVTTGGTDPLVKSPKEKSNFNMISEEMFQMVVINGFITNESKPKKTVGVTKDGVQMKKVTKYVRVDKRKVKEYLTQKQVIISKDELTEAVGTPYIMVLPEPAKGVDPLDLLSNNLLAKAGAAAIESYLTAREYDVLVPEAANVLNKISQMSSELAGVDEDPIAKINRVIGSDVYVTYLTVIKKGSNGTRKASVTVKAYETTTGRLLGSETGYSPSLKINSDQALIENAIGDAINNVLARVQTYWKKDMKKGLQYKVTFRIADFKGAMAEEITDKIADVLESEFEKTKEVLITNNTVEYIVWASQDDYSSGNSIYRMLRKQIEKSARNATVSRISVNKKFVLVKIESK